MQKQPIKQGTGVKESRRESTRRKTSQRGLFEEPSSDELDVHLFSHSSRRQSGSPEQSKPMGALEQSMANPWLDPPVQSKVDSTKSTKQQISSNAIPDNTLVVRRTTERSPRRQDPLTQKPPRQVPPKKHRKSRRPSRQDPHSQQYSNFKYRQLHQDPPLQPRRDPQFQTRRDPQFQPRQELHQDPRLRQEQPQASNLPSHKIPNISQASGNDQFRVPLVDKYGDNQPRSKRLTKNTIPNEPESIVKYPLIHKSHTSTQAQGPSLARNLDLAPFQHHSESSRVAATLEELGDFAEFGDYSNMTETVSRINRGTDRQSQREEMIQTVGETMKSDRVRVQAKQPRSQDEDESVQAKQPRSEDKDERVQAQQPRSED